MFENFKELFNSVEAVSVLDSVACESNFTVGMRIEETEVGWIALEAIARLSSNCGLTLAACANEMPGSLSFEIRGELANLGEAIIELDEIVCPTDSQSARLIA